MQTSAPIGPPEEDRDGSRRAVTRLLAYLPRGNTLDDRSWRRRHRLLKWVLLLHVPGMALLGLLVGTPLPTIGYALIAPAAFLVLGHVLRSRRLASFSVTGGLVFCSAGLVVITSGSIEAHFHFFIIIGFIALYQDWVPFLWNVGFTVISHGIGTIWLGGLIFAHPYGQANPWLWSAIHGVAVLFACVGMVIFWRITEDEQSEKEALGRRLVTADAEIGRRRFTSEMLVNLARRNQSMLYRQLDIINQLEEKERDPDTLSDLFTLDHLATRVRRNAESLLVLAGEQPPRTWSAPVPLRDVVRAAIAETEDLDRVVFAIDDRPAVSGASVADLTHLLAELTENAVRFSPPETAVTIRARPDGRVDGGYLLTIEDWGVGMPPENLAEANELLANPREVDLAVAQRLGFHVVARLAARHGISVSLGNTPGSGVTAIVGLPASLFAAPAAPVHAATITEARPYVTGQVHQRREPWADPRVESTGWVEPVSTSGAVRGGVVPVPRPAPEPEAQGGWRGWWNPESAVPAARESVEAGRWAGGIPVAGAANGNGRGTGNGGGHGAARGDGTLTGYADRVVNGNGHGAAEGRVGGAVRDVGTAADGHTGGPGNDHLGGAAGGHPGEAATRSTGGVAEGYAAGAQPRTAPQLLPPAPAVRVTPSPRPRPGPAPATGEPVIPAPRSGPERPAGGRPGLRRRVPQAHLAPELRQASVQDTDAAVAPDGAAASALSRYQASRQAAQAVVDESGAEGMRS